jgi:hypothetical protein
MLKLLGQTPLLRFKLRSIYFVCVISDDLSFYLSTNNIHLFKLIKYILYKNNFDIAKNKSMKLQTNFFLLYRHDQGSFFLLYRHDQGHFILLIFPYFTNPF